MPKLVLARGDITPTDELVIVLSEPDNEPAAVLIHWPAAAPVAPWAAPVSGRGSPLPRPARAHSAPSRCFSPPRSAAASWERQSSGLRDGVLPRSWASTSTSEADWKGS